MSKIGIKRPWPHGWIGVWPEQFAEENKDGLTFEQSEYLGEHKALVWLKGDGHIKEIQFGLLPIGAKLVSVHQKITLPLFRAIFGSKVPESAMSFMNPVAPVLMEEQAPPEVVVPRSEVMGISTILLIVGLFMFLK